MQQKSERILQQHPNGGACPEKRAFKRCLNACRIV
uniref:Uncharacterized protein n=1 Tax=Myoviridae sp. ctf4L13 TaxID=2825147 RepID=A0A8S5V897_9CAUD|nr:MAG TPA: hypothetical protein [Myoviridae sp. ctf4L13]